VLIGKPVILKTLHVILFRSLTSAARKKIKKIRKSICKNTKAWQIKNSASHLRQRGGQRSSEKDQKNPKVDLQKLKSVAN